MKNIVNITVYVCMELNLKKWKKQKQNRYAAKSKRNLQIGTSAILWEDIDHIHRSGMEYMEKNSTKKLKYIIMKFKSWDM